MTGHNGTTGTEKPLPKDAELAAELARGRSYRDAGAAVGLSAATVARRMARPSFAAAVRDARDRFMAEALASAVSSASAAVAVLRDIAENTRVPPGVRVRAAIGLLQTAIKLREQYDLTERVAALETAANTP